MEFVTNGGCMDGHCSYGLGEEFNGDFGLQYEDESTNDQHSREDNHRRKSKKHNRYLKIIIFVSNIIIYEQIIINLTILLLRRRKGKKSRKDRKKENSMSEFDTKYHQNVWKTYQGEDANDYDGEDDSSSSSYYHRDTNYQLNNGMKQLK